MTDGSDAGGDKVSAVSFSPVHAYHDKDNERINPENMYGLK